MTRRIGFSEDPEPRGGPSPSERAQPLTEDEAKFGKPIAGFSHPLPERPSAEAIVAGILEKDRNEHRDEIVGKFLSDIYELRKEEPLQVPGFLDLFHPESTRHDVITGVTHRLKMLKRDETKHGKLIKRCERFLAETKSLYQ